METGSDSHIRGPGRRDRRAYNGGPSNLVCGRAVQAPNESLRCKFEQTYLFPFMKATRLNAVQTRKMSKNKTATQAPSSAAALPVQQISIDGTAYNLEDLTDTARQQLVNVRLVDQELARLQRQRAIATVARTAYAGAVAAALPKEPTAPADGTRSAVINGITYDWASLGERVQGLLTGIRAADQELARLNVQTQLAQTARNTFAQVIKQNLPKA